MKAVVAAACAVLMLAVSGVSGGCSGKPNEIRGIRNSARVSPVLYRAGQPTPEGFRNAQALGIKTVVNLRRTHSDRELVESLGMDYVHLKMSPFRPTDEQIVQIMRIVEDPARQPVLIYCQAGGDRTGCAVGVYRVVAQGWTKDAAVVELHQYGFIPFLWGLSDYIRKLDTAELKERVSPPTVENAQAAP